MQMIIYLIKEVKMVESAKLNKHEKLLENDIVEYMELFIKSKDCIELLTKANNDHRIKVIMMLTKYKRQDYASYSLSQEMIDSQQMQRDVIAKMCDILLDDFKH